MSVTKYVSKVSPADFEFAVMVVDLIDELADMIEDFDEATSAQLDMMKFIYGDGQ